MHFIQIDSGGAAVEVEWAGGQGLLRQGGGKWWGVMYTANILFTFCLPQSQGLYEWSGCSGVFSAVVSSPEGREKARKKEVGHFLAAGLRSMLGSACTGGKRSWHKSVMWPKYFKPRTGLSPRNIYEGTWANYCNRVSSLLLHLWVVGAKASPFQSATLQATEEQCHCHGRNQPMGSLHIQSEPFNALLSSDFIKIGLSSSSGVPPPPPQAGQQEVSERWVSKQGKLHLYLRLWPPELHLLSGQWWH